MKDESAGILCQKYNSKGNRRRRPTATNFNCVIVLNNPDIARSSHLQSNFSSYTFKDYNSTPPHPLYSPATPDPPRQKKKKIPENFFAGTSALREVNIFATACGDETIPWRDRRQGSASCAFGRKEF